MTEESRGLARAVAALRAELHSRGLGGSHIAIEVDAEKWHALRVKNALAGDVKEIAIVTDVVAGDVVVRPKPSESITATLEQLADLGLQKPTLEHRVEVLETQLRSLLTRLGFAGAL